VSFRLVFLGSGSSGGVPRIGGSWGACDPQNPRNRRRRCAVLVQRFGKNGHTSVLIDTPPDIREQLIDAGVDHINGVLYTHDHADHTHGIDDLRAFFHITKRRVDVHMDAATRASLESRFSYCFSTKPGSGYVPILEAHDICPPKPVLIDGPGGPIDAIPVIQEHGEITSLGFRFGGLAYSPDISDLPNSSLALFAGLDVWIVDALRPMPHPSHWSVKQALEWIERLQPKRAILTHMTAELDYAALKRGLPPHIEPAYDGMTVDF
jgi:phosphoribosyl 1,2-cyclic phosphate phosphodiesterase